MKVVVLEAAGYFNESDFYQLELSAYEEMYWRGGPTPTADGNVSLQAGPRSAAARRSTGPTACARAPGCASSGRASTASRASAGPSSTATSTR